MGPTYFQWDPRTHCTNGGQRSAALVASDAQICEPSNFPNVTPCSRVSLYRRSEQLLTLPAWSFGMSVKYLAARRHVPGGSALRTSLPQESVFRGSAHCEEAGRGEWMWTPRRNGPRRSGLRRARCPSTAVSAASRIPSIGGTSTQMLKCLTKAYKIGDRWMLDCPSSDVSETVAVVQQTCLSPSHLRTESHACSETSSYSGHSPEFY